ncbi:MAG: gamma-glutamylcyclotransferase [Holophagales bacterium]|nr:gamma-glutamylcyclotransferase [Holophagales bacterium]
MSRQEGEAATTTEFRGAGSPVRYFAYGSNMAAARLRARVGAIRRVGVFALQGHDLRFHKAGSDGSGKCDAFYTGAPTHRVEGLVFELTQPGLHLLDSFEGLGRGYDRARMRVESARGRQIEAFVYLATELDTDLLPYAWYRHHVLVGAYAAGLRREYVERIERVETKPDPDRDRARREFAIHTAESVGTRPAPSWSASV